MSPTAIVVLGAFIALGLYDAFVVARGGIGTSISRFLQRIGFKSPLFVFAIGAIIGHVWFSMAPECDCPVPEIKTHASPS